MKVFRIATVIFIMLLLISNLMASTTGKIVGRIIDATSEETLIGVNVYLEGTSQGATTDLDGFYVILNIPPGKYTLVADYIGYQIQKRTGVSVSIDLTTTEDFSLSVQTLELDEVIVVQGDRPLLQKDITSSQALVSSDEIEVLPVNEVYEVIQLQAGVTTDADGGIHIRGGRTEEINYQVNGVANRDAYDNSVGVEIDNSSIQELQVISGTFNAEYGDAMSGIINVVTKEGSKTYEGSIMAFGEDYVSNNTELFPNVDAFNPTVNIQGSLSGPIPFTNDQVTFFVMARYYDAEGYLYGFNNFQPDGSEGDGKAVPMNSNKRIMGQAKLAWYIVPELKFLVEALGSTREFQDYAHEWKWTPNGNVNKFADSFSGSASLTHTLSSTSFYKVMVSGFDSQFEEYLYKDTQDSRYLHPDSLIQPVDLMWRQVGTNMHRFERRTQTYSGYFDFTSQVSRRHLLKLGVQGNTNTLTLDDYNLTESPDHVPGNEFVPYIPLETATSRNKFKREPYQFAAYIQDKIEFEEVIINIGLRFDYFNSNSEVLVDTRDPNILIPLRSGMDSLSVEERHPFYRKDSTPKTYLSPRFGIAYPISASGVIHFSYGHFVQIPSFQYLFNRSDYKVPETGSPGDVYGNPDLEMQKTVMYELGLKHEFGGEYLVDVTGFYRDVRDWVTSQTFSTANLVAYALYVNRDYANVRGLTINFKKNFSNHWGFNMNYTFQIAEGSNSSPEEEFNNARGNNEPTIFLLPMDWDKTHLLNFALNVGGPSWGSTLLARYGSGLPFTPQITQYSSDRGISSAPQRNSGSRPDQFLLDLNVFYLFNISDYQIKAFIKVFNLLDDKVVSNVFTDTGEPDFTVEYRNKEEDERRGHSFEDYLVRPWHYFAPRRLQLGVEWLF
jgi:outer membrane receptor protein involved in Fe transport